QPPAISPLAPELPLGCSCSSLFAREFFVRNALTHDAQQRHVKAVRISCLAIVEAKCLFVKVTIEMKRFHTDVGSRDAALQERPEVFKAVCMDATIYVLN